MAPTAFAGFPGDMKVLVQTAEDGDWFQFHQQGCELENLSVKIPGEIDWFHTSPDTSKIIFLVEAGAGLFEYWLYDLAGGDPARLFELKGQDWVLLFSLSIKNGLKERWEEHSPREDQCRDHLTYTRSNPCWEG
jgi:hypothetical protein